MGIGTQNAKSLIATLKAGTTGKAALRAELADAINVLNDKLHAIDAQLAQAEKDFAASKQGQFNTFVEALPDVGDLP